MHACIQISYYCAVFSGQSSSTFSNEGIADDFFLLPRNNFLMNGERDFQGAELAANSCQGYCSGHSDDCLPGQQMKDSKTTRPTHRPLHSLAEQAPGHKQSCTRDIWISPRTSCAKSQVENINYFNIDDAEEDVFRRKRSSPQMPFVKGERVFDGNSGRSVDFEKACKVRKTTAKNYHPSRDQETQTLHETASAFSNPAGSSRARDFIELSRQNHSPTVTLQAGNSFQLLPTFIPVPSDPNAACFVSPTLGYPVSAAGHSSFAQMPSTTHVLHPGNGGQDRFVYLPSQMYSHVPHAVSTVYTSQVANATTVGSPSALPVVLAPGRVAYNGPHAPMSNYAIPGPAFVPSSPPGGSMGHAQRGGHVNSYRQYLMRPGSHVLHPMYQ